MKTRILIVVLSILGLMASWSGRAAADHPVKEIPIRVVRVAPHTPGWTQPDNVLRQVELANRIYASAGIKFKFDPNNGFTDPLDGELNCWGDDIVDDVSEANYFAWTNIEEIVVVVPRYEAYAAGQSCIQGSCYADTDCCPGHWHWESNGQGGQVQVCDAGVMCDLGVHQCMRNYYKGGPSRCFDNTCNPLSACEPVDPPGTEPGSPFILFRPMNNDGIVKLAHEAGHYYGLAHTHEDPGTERCYDIAEGDVPVDDPVEDCDPDHQEPFTGGSPSICSGPYLGCTQTNIPWRNIMGYIDDCQARYAGEWPYLGGWNSSLSLDQIKIIHKAMDTFWDPDVTGPNDNPLKHGGYERMQVASSSGSSEYRGMDSWNTVWPLPVGDSGWTKGNVTIKAADVNGDGRMDAIVSANGGSHPHTTLWIRQSSGSLAFSQALWAAGGANMKVAVGNVTGDGSDDAMLTYNGISHVYRGQYGASTMTWDTMKSWGTSDVKIYVGNFAGPHELAVPLPQGWGYEMHVRHQQDVANLGNYNNVSYDDVLSVMPWPTGSRIFPGDSHLDLTVVVAAEASYTTASVKDVWAVNMLVDYHDEMVLRDNSGFKVIRGGDDFDFTDVAWNLSYSRLLVARVSTGNISGSSDFQGADSPYGDLLITTIYGTNLYLGFPTGVAGPAYTRADLTPSNTKHVTSDFIRRGRDDVMFYTTSGSWLYAGARGYPHLVPNVWQDAALTYSSVEWFGTQQ